ncbi:MAG: restriction endonuclease subunit S [Archangium sp.]|nr:restriction endonuclease subunit S [Archangium sp.]
MSGEWHRRSIGEFATRKKVINELGDDLPPLSVTKDRGVVLQSEKYNKRVATDPSKYVIVEDGDFAFDPMSLYYGSLGRVRGIGQGLISPDYVAFTVDSSVDADFIEYLLRSPAMVQKYERVAQQGNQFGKRRRVYWSVLQDQAVDVPPLGEQRRIAAILSSIDHAIEKTEAVIAQVGVVKNALMTQMLTRGMPGRHADFKTTAVGEIPAPWRVSKLADVAKIVTGSTPGTKEPAFWGGGIPFFTPGDLGKSVWVTDAERTVTGAGAANGRLLPRGAVLMTCIGATIGKQSIAARPCISNQQINAAICDEEMEPEFLYYALARGRDRLWAMAGRTAVPIVNKGKYEELQVPVPPLTEQRDILRVLRALDENLVQNRSALEALFVVKAGLLAALLSGRVLTTGGAAR